MLHRMQCDIVQTSGKAISALLAEMEDETELFASQATLRWVELHLLVIAQTLAHLAAPLHRRLLLIDWHGWDHLRRVLESDAQPRRDEIWYGVRALTPQTLEMIQQLRVREPSLFEFGY